MNSYLEEEIKVLDVDVDELQKTLENLGAERVFEGERIFTTFDTKDKKYTPKGTIVRLTEEEKLKLSVTTIVGKDERETVKVFTSRKKETVDFLSRIGLFPIAKVTSHRASYELGKVDVDIDKFPEIPAFVEIDVGDLETSQEKLLEKLGLKNKEVFVGGTEELYRKYKQDYFKLFRI